MKGVLSLLTCVFLSTPAAAMEIAGQTELSGKPIVVYTDGTWRFDDAVGNVCTPLKNIGRLCALPSEWHLFQPRERVYHPVFRHTEALMGEAFKLSSVSSTKMTTDDVVSFLRRQAVADGMQGLMIGEEQTKIGSKPADTLIMLGAGGVRVASYAHYKEGFVVALTVEQATIYTADHKRAHASFVSSLLLEDQE